MASKAFTDISTLQDEEEKLIGEVALLLQSGASAGLSLDETNQVMTREQTMRDKLKSLVPAV